MKTLEEHNEMCCKVTRTIIKTLHDLSEEVDLHTLLSLTLSAYGSFLDDCFVGKRLEEKDD